MHRTRHRQRGAALHLIVHFLPFGASFVLWCCAMTWAASLGVGELWRGPQRPAYLR